MFLLCSWGLAGAGDEAVGGLIPAISGTRLAPEAETHGLGEPPLLLQLGSGGPGHPGQAQFQLRLLVVQTGHLQLRRALPRVRRHLLHCRWSSLLSTGRVGASSLFSLGRLTFSLSPSSDPLINVDAWIDGDEWPGRWRHVDGYRAVWIRPREGKWTSGGASGYVNGPFGVWASPCRFELSPGFLRLVGSARLTLDSFYWYSGQPCDLFLASRRRNSEIFFKKRNSNSYPGT